MKANWIMRLLATGLILSLTKPVWAQQVCDPDNPDADGDGTRADGSVCIGQDNGTGVCVPEKIKVKDKNNA